MNMAHLVLKGIAIREHINRAEDVFEQHFTKPVREWLFKQDGGVAEVLGIAKPCIQMAKDKTVIDEARLMEDIRDLVKAGAISDVELRTMVQDGTFTLGTATNVVDKVASKLKKTAAAYNILVKGKPGFAVRWNGIDGSKERIASEYPRLSDIAEKVEEAASTDLEADVLKRMMGA